MPADILLWFYYAGRMDGRPAGIFSADVESPWARSTRGCYAQFARCVGRRSAKRGSGAGGPRPRKAEERYLGSKIYKNGNVLLTYEPAKKAA
jgi:hypothetical protein